MNPFVIAPSILSADFARLGDEVNAVLDGGADWVHFDVMDNHYVPNLTIGPMVCKALRNHGVEAVIDVHLMVEPVDQCIAMFAEAGASNITFHPEASKHVHRSLQLAKSLGVKTGLVLNPATPVTVIEPVIDELDIVLLMSVNPGFGGQKFIPQTLQKIDQVRALLDAANSSARIQVDGGVTLDNIAEIASHGADTFVAGSAIYGAQNYADAIAHMRASLAS